MLRAHTLAVKPRDPKRRERFCREVECALVKEHTRFLFPLSPSFLHSKRAGAHTYTSHLLYFSCLPLLGLPHFPTKQSQLRAF